MVPTPPPSVQGVGTVQGPGADNPRKGPRGPPSEPVTWAPALPPSDATSAAVVKRDLDIFMRLPVCWMLIAPTAIANGVGGLLSLTY